MSGAIEVHILVTLHLTGCDGALGVFCNHVVNWSSTRTPGTATSFAKTLYQEAHPPSLLLASPLSPFSISRVFPFREDFRFITVVFCSVRKLF